MEPEPALPAKRLIADLNRLRRDAGSPSLGELARLSKPPLATSTLHDHLVGRRSRLPPWRLVSAYVSACHAAAAETGLDVKRLGSLEEWHAKWIAAHNGNHDVASEAGDENSTKLGTKPYPIQNDSADPPHHSAAGSRSVTDEYNDATAALSIAPVIRRLEEDLSSLGRSLPTDTGLLVVTSGPSIGTRFVIEHNITTIGRAPESDIWLNDPTVSRHHAVIYRRGDNFFLRDAESRNGTLIRRQLVQAETRLFAYDEMRIAAFTLMFVQAGQQPKRARKSYEPIRSQLIEDTSGSTKDFRAFPERRTINNDQPWTTRRGLWFRRRPRARNKPE